jgi:hypothetical protein
MRSAGEINTILKEIALLPPEDQVYIAEILDKRIQDLKRDQLLSRAEEAEENYRKRKVEKGSAEDLINKVSDG